MSEFKWWQTGVIYQIYPRSYQDTTGNGIGDLRGVIDRLDYLSEVLGVNAIWLSPFYPSPMADFGYDISDYCDVDPMFGNLGDFDELVTRAHARNIRIIIDWVPNHSSDQHPWFQESRASREDPKRDWYVWKDPRLTDENGEPKREPPNNWLAVFGGSAWEWDSATGQYYLHSFLKEQPDLNWRNPELKNAMFDTIRFWLEKGVDGFRVDVAHYIMKDPDFRDNPPADPGAVAFHRPHGKYDAQLHLYDKGHPDVHSIYREFRAVLDGFNGKSPRTSIGEIHIFDMKDLVTYYGTPEGGLEFHMPFNFSLLRPKWQAREFQSLIDAYEAALPEWAWPNYVLGNHDEGRLATRYGQEQARVAAMLLLTLRGTPTIYYGDELGMTDVDIPPEQQLDPFGFRVPGWGRDRCRTPMQWNAGTNAGFSSAKPGELWLPVSEQYPTVNLESQQKDPASIFNLYRNLLQLRKSSPALQVGMYTSVTTASPDCFAYTRTIQAESYLVILNFSSNETNITLQDSGRGKMVLSTYLDRTGEVDLRNLNLRGDEGLIVQING
jgi:alpha-glucosidase